jgi:hypothetical protein
VIGKHNKKQQITIKLQNYSRLDKMSLTGPTRPQD